MRNWYHNILLISLILLTIQNALIILLAFFSEVQINLVLFLDLLGFGLFFLSLIFHVIVTRSKYAFASVIGLLMWLISRLYLQFSVLSTYNIDYDLDKINESISNFLIESTILLFISAIGFLIAFTALSMISEWNLTLFIIYGATNLIAVILILVPFLFPNGRNLEELVDSASIGLAIKALIVPILGIFAFSTGVFKTEKILTSDQ